MAVMFRDLFLIFSIISAASAKIIAPNYKGFDEDNGLVKADVKVNYKSVKSYFEEPVWVLKLSDDTLTDLKLRPGTGAESDDFNDIVAPLMARLKLSKKSKVVKKDSAPVDKEDGSSKDGKLNTKDEVIKSDIMRMVNKFMFTANLEPSITVDENFSPSLVLYFKGPIASVTVKDTNDQWSSVMGIITPPSPLPEWFYEDHGAFDYEGDNYIAVPDTVRHAFYKALASVLKKFLGHPM